MKTAAMDGRAVDPDSPVPLRAQVEDWLRRLIARPEYQQGEMLPDELSLAARLGVSRGTLRAGISRLVFEGLLDRRPGLGTRVARRASESGIAAWRSLTREMARKGVMVETFRLECRMVLASVAAAGALRIEVGARVLRLDRLRGWGGAPVLHSRSWFHPRLGLTGEEDYRRPLYEAVEAVTGVAADSAHEELQAVAADTRMAKLLRVPAGSPLLLRRHVVFDRGRRPMEFAEVHYVSERFSLTIDLRRGEE